MILDHYNYTTSDEARTISRGERKEGIRRVALYARVSLEETDQNDRRYQEPENQLTPLREWAARMGWQIHQEYVDRGSGADSSRLQFRELLKDAMLLHFHTILIWKWDRFTREPMFTAVGRVQKLRDRGVGIKSLTESWLDTAKDNPVADVVLAIMGWAAAEERRKISERTRGGIARRRAIGQWKGGRPRKCRKCGLQESRGRYSRAELCQCRKKGGSRNGPSTSPS